MAVTIAFAAMWSLPVRSAGAETKEITGITVRFNSAI